MIPLQQPQPPTYNHPCGVLLQGDQRDLYIGTCIPLYTAIMERNLEKVKTYILPGDEFQLVGYSITENQETPLHIAALAQSTEIVQYIMEFMNLDLLKLRNRDGNTALCIAAIVGNVRMARIIVGDRPELLTIRGSQGMMPLHLAALYGNRDMVTYLYGQSRKMRNDGWTDSDWDKLLLNCIEADLFDVASRILTDNVEIPQGIYVWEVLHVLAQKPCAFDDIEPRTIWKTICSILHLNDVGSETKVSEATIILKTIWKKIVAKPKNEIDDILRGPMINNNGMQQHPFRILFVAAETGNTGFLLELIRTYPDLIWMRNDNGQSIFHVAVARRCEGVYSLLYTIGSMKDLLTPLTDQEGNNMLHLVGMNADKDPYENSLTAPFQMQRELLWFKEVKALIPPFCREAKNTAGQTPTELFIESHEELVLQSKKWMKETTNQCMVAAVLIATIGYSVVWTTPGGYDQDSGLPMFLHDGHLIAFVIFDAISFILSSVSILMFLSIVISRYTQTDFLESLPQKLTIGLVTLFLSILTMMISFGVRFFILYHHKLMVVPFIIWALGIIPIVLYTKLQYPLLADVFHSRYGSKYLFKPKKHMLYQHQRL